MARKNEYNYFDTFVKLVEYSCSASKLLDEILENFNVDELQNKMDLMHDIEHSADLESHNMMRKLAHEFITPIEREDIVSLSHEIDNITDNIEDVLLTIYMYNVRSIRNDVLDFSKLIVKCCFALKKAFQEFKKFHKSTDIKDEVILINKLEEEGDKLYTRTVRNLHMLSSDPLEIMAWTEVYKQLEKCCDSCESTVNLIESIIMKNS